MTDPIRILIHNLETEKFAIQTLNTFPGSMVEECDSYDALPALLAKFRPDIVYTVRFDGTLNYPRDALFSKNGPKWVANGGAGTDHFGMWNPTTVTVTNTAGVAADMMAEYVMGSFLHYTLGIAGLQTDKAQKQWLPRKVKSLKGQTLLIIGLGHTGQAIAQRAKAFGMKVIGTRARPEPMEHVDEVHPADNLINLIPRADFIAVCTPLTPKTRGLIGITEIEAMKRGVILADVSRGGVIEGAELYKAIQSGKVAGAALDVFETEPLPPDSNFWSSENTLISPHCSSVFDGWEDASFSLFLENVERWIKGDPLENIVDPSRGY